LKIKNYFHLTFTFHIALSSLSTFGAIIPAVDLEQTIVLAFVLLLRYLPGVQVTLVLHQADPCPEYLFFNKGLNLICKSLTVGYECFIEIVVLH